MAICSTNGGMRIQTQVCFLFAFEELRGLEIQQQLCRIDFISDFWTVYYYMSLRLSGETVLAGDRFLPWGGQRAAQYVDLCDNSIYWLPHLNVTASNRCS